MSNGKERRARLKAGANAGNLVDTSQLIINEKKNIQGFFLTEQLLPDVTCVAIAFNIINI
jgi:hypothetical protein